ncbi:MAG: ComEA family DNA-binding protein [Anaerolineales bacterium]|nr:ComEA family DNA-binding protein [Anaerolineales bacterium]
MKTGWALALGVICGLLGAGIILLVSRPQGGSAITLLPPPSPIPMVVYVSGAVARPDIYTMPAGSRVRDAIQAAGGLSSQADPQSLNLAAFLEDGMKIQVAQIIKTPIAPGAMIGTSNSSATGLSQGVASSLVNINTASQQELDTLPEIGPALAQRIIAYRTAKGPFTKIEDIQNVSGIGAVTFEKIKDMITIGN